MTNLAASSSESSTVTFSRARPFGVPDSCWCGVPTIPKTSRSELNPGRRYFRCTTAAANMLSNDGHCFKWINEALLDEWRKMKYEIQSLQEQINMMEMKQGELNKKMKKTVVALTLMCVGISFVLRFV